MSTPKSTEQAAAERAEYVAALEAEREGYERAGLKGRAEGVKAEIKRAKSAAPSARRAPKAEDGG